MSVEESLHFFDETVAALDRVHEKQLYESESDLISEFGYASGYTELSATSDGEDRQLKHSAGGNRRRKSRQNRHQRFQNDPILGDLESDSTNDGQLFGSEVTPRVRTRTNSGQRRQRERRRQRRQNANRNSWTDSGLSSKTDSQRSSHSETSPFKRGRSKTVIAACVDKVNEVEIVHVTDAERNGQKPTEKRTLQHDSGVSSPGLSASSPVNDGYSLEKDIASPKANKDITSSNGLPGQIGIDVPGNKESSYELPVEKMDEKPVGSSSLVNSFDSSSKSLQEFFIDIKPTNWRGVVNGTYTPKEKEILHQVIQNAQNSSQNANDSFQSPRGSQSSKFPLPPHLDYPFCMYRQNEKKAKKSSGLMKGLRKLKQGITNKRNSTIANNEVLSTKSQDSHGELSDMPPSRQVEKKKGLLKRIFKQNSEAKSQKSTPFRRNRFGSTRSFSGSVSQIFARGSRARSQSVENLKNCLRRGRDSIMKRSGSAMSLNGKMTRSLSVSSLVGRRNAFTRQGSMVSIAGQFTRSNGVTSGFRRADSVRSLHGGYDIATRVLQSSHVQQNCCEDRNDNVQPMPMQNIDFNAPFRAGWRPASRISRREPYLYDDASCYDENDFVNYNDCYVNDESCPCCYDEPYYEDGAYYNDYYENSMDQYYDPREFSHSQIMLANMDARSVRQHMPRAPSSLSINNPRMRPQSQIASYYSPANTRRDTRMVVAPLSVHVTQERRAERRQLSTSSYVCDTMV